MPSSPSTATTAATTAAANGLDIIKERGDDDGDEEGEETEGEGEVEETEEGGEEIEEEEGGVLSLSPEERLAMYTGMFNTALEMADEA